MTRANGEYCNSGTLPTPLTCAGGPLAANAHGKFDGRKKRVLVKMIGE